MSRSLRIRDTKKSTSTFASISRCHPNLKPASIASDDDDNGNSLTQERPPKRTKLSNSTKSTKKQKQDNAKKKKQQPAKKKSQIAKKKTTKQRSSSNKKRKKEDEEREDEKEGEEGEEGDEEADETSDNDPMAEEDGESPPSSSSSPLSHLTSEKHGRIFSELQQQKNSKPQNQQESQQHQQPRGNLPVVLIHSICDILPMLSLIALAKVSRTSYATVREYGESLVLVESKRIIASDPLGDDIEFLSLSEAVNSHAPHRRLGYRNLKKDIAVMHTFTGVQIVASQLRHLVTSLLIRCEVDLDQVSHISRGLPHLRCLILHSLRSRREKSIVLPKYLRSLSVTFGMYGPAPFRSAWMTRLASKISELKYLNEFRLMDRYLQEELGLEILVFTMKLPRLRYFHSEIPNLIATRMQLESFSSNLTSISQRPDPNPTSDTLIFQSLIDGKARASTPLPPLRNFDFSSTLEHGHIASLSKFASTLISIAPSSWETEEVVWLSAFTQLRVLTINNSLEPKGRMSLIRPLTETFIINTQKLVESLCRLTQLTRLHLFVHRLDNAQLETTLRSLTSLQHLGIGSNEVISIGCFSQIPHLINHLDTLMIRFPKLPRDEVCHLYSLRWLSQLEIAGSFVEPLYARQLLPFKIRSVRQPYLRHFVPRSSSEPVPIPPIDLATQEQERIQFDKRMRLGQVRSAEMINSDQLCLILQILDVKEFSFAARTCRSWRRAASQRSAWSSGNTGRTFILQGDAPECVPSILPHLPLWRNARRVRFHLTRPEQTGNALTPRLMNRSSIAEPLTAVASLPRLESLELHCPSSLNDANYWNHLTSFITQIESRLNFLTVHSLFKHAFNSSWLEQHDFSHLHELDLNLAMLSAKLVQLRWSTMTRLHSFSTNQVSSSIGDALRQLSLDHQLRHVKVRIVHTAPGHAHDDSHLHPAQDTIRQELMQFLLGLTGQLTPAMQGLAPMKPATIETLHLRIDQPSKFTPFDLFCDLPQLIDLHVEVIPSMLWRYEDSDGFGRVTFLAPPTLWSFQPWPQQNDYAFQKLQTFYYAGAMDARYLANLAQAKQMRSLTLIDPWYMRQTRVKGHDRTWSARNSTVLPVGCMKKWLHAWTALEEFHLEGIQIQGSELEGFVRFGNTLRSFHLSHVSTTPLSDHNFSFLTSCTRLESLELKCILGLTLSPRQSWFDHRSSNTDKGAPAASVSSSVLDADGDIDMKTDAVVLGSSNTTTAASATSSTSSSYFSLIESIRSCSQLRNLKWGLHPHTFDASVAYTLEHAKIGRQSIAVRREREWMRERYTLKSRLHDRWTNTGGVSQPIHHPSLTIRYTSCYEEILRYRDKVLLAAEEMIIISSIKKLDLKDRDLEAYREETQLLEKKNVIESKKRKAEVIEEKEEEQKESWMSGRIKINGALEFVLL